METIFDFNPSAQEAQEIAFNPLTMALRCGVRSVEYTQAFYIAHIRPDWALFDIAILHEDREDSEGAERYWEQIPDIANEYKMGKDYITYPSSDTQ